MYKTILKNFRPEPPQSVYRPIFFISGVVPSRNEIKLFSKILKCLVFYFNTEPRLKWNKIVLAAKTILFHLRRGSVLK